MQVHGCRIEMIHPLAMLWMAIREDGSYVAMVRNALQQRPPTQDCPWRFALYSDEVTPDNVVSPGNLRTIWVVYWALVECSRQALHKEDAWFYAISKTVIGSQKGARWHFVRHA